MSDKSTSLNLANDVHWNLIDAYNKRRQSMLLEWAFWLDRPSSVPLTDLFNHDGPFHFYGRNLEAMTRDIDAYVQSGHLIVENGIITRTAKKAPE